MKKIALKSVIFLVAIIALFSCASENIVLKTVPQLATNTITNITSTAASSGGNIAGDGGEAVTARGIVWNTTTAPTINLSTKTNDGAGIGIFSSTITNLIPSSTYFVRAYATNSIGTAYGSEVNFNTPNCNAGSTITDIDGNIYNTIVIGNQVWMKENLNTSKYSNGDPITNLTSRNDWQYSSAGGSSYYGFVVNNLEGKLYNGFAVQDPRGLCPCGYHVPSKNEWIIFQNYLTALGASSGVNPAKAIASKINWVLSTVANTVGNNPNLNNTTNFSAFPSGISDGYGRFGGKGESTIWWTNDKGWWSAEIYSTSTDFFYAQRKDSAGYSIRCLKN